ncbi:MAG: hypothetical protein ABW196_00870 [Solirubrobacterales bacterium]
MRPWVDPDRSFWVRRPRTKGAWTKLAREYTEDEERRPLDQVLAVAREGGCRTVVIENRYVDVDYRSEFTAFWSLKFDNQSSFARRMHFFAADLDEGRLHNLSEKERKSYLGYSIIRPVPHGRVGRTVLAPPPELDGATLTPIVDEVSFFGNPLQVEGVPFCEQDSEFLRCAHAAVWICHYTAARRGHVGRRSTAQIVERSPTGLSPKRALPSPGLNLNQLQFVFGELDQPAIHYGMSHLPHVIGVEEPACPDEEDAKEETPAGLWDTRMNSIICRYLNSGFPVLIGAEEHAFVLVGWRRDDEGQVQFIGCDDRVGPYEVISSPFEHYMKPWESIMIPLPPKVYLSGESAEGRAHEVLTSFAEQAEQAEELRHIGEGLADGSIELRSTLRTCAAYKRDIGDLTRSEATRSALRHARLPHWIWVVEAHKKDLCAKGKPCVVAAAVLDSTAFGVKPPLDILAMPGMVTVYPPDEGKVVQRNGGAAPWGSLLEVH